MIIITSDKQNRKENPHAIIMVCVTTTGSVTLMVVLAPTPFIPQELASAYRLWMDIHSAKSSNQQLIRLEGAAYVPHGTLVPQGSRNLLVAGRCLCADQGAYASIRVQATLMSIGEAAGLMAAMHCATGKDVSALPEKELAESFAKRAFVL